MNLYEFKLVIHEDYISDTYHEVYDIYKEGFCISDSDDHAYRIAQRAAKDWYSRAEVKSVNRRDYIIINQKKY